MLGFSLSYFFFQCIKIWFEVGPEFSIGKIEFEDLDIISTWSIGAKANAHFDTGGQVTPYAGLNLGFSNLEVLGEDESTFYYGLQAGLDYFLTDNVSINPELRYTMATYDFGADVDVTQINFLIGIAAHF